MLGHGAFAARAEAKVRARGFADFDGVAPTLVRAMRAGGASRIAILAERARITPQGMGQIVTEMEKRGYVETAPDPDDRRARLVTYTPKGRRLAEAAVQAIEEVQAEFKALVGARKFAALKSLLGELVDGLPETKAYAGNFFAD